MKRIAIATLTAAVLASVCVPAAWSAEKPSDRVVVMYFHRTQRCPTCQKMGSYSKEAVKQGLAELVDNGAVEFHYIDFQQPANIRFAEAYKVEGPALIVAKIVNGKVQEYKNLEEIWMKVREKPAFIEYVQGGVQAYLK